MLLASFAAIRSPISTPRHARHHPKPTNGGANSKSTDVGPKMIANAITGRQVLGTTALGRPASSLFVRMPRHLFQTMSPKAITKPTIASGRYAQDDLLWNTRKHAATNAVSNASAIRGTGIILFGTSPANTVIFAVSYLVGVVFDDDISDISSAHGSHSKAPWASLRNRILS